MYMTDGIVKVSVAEKLKYSFNKHVVVGSLWSELTFVNRYSANSLALKTIHDSEAPSQ